LKLVAVQRELSGAVAVGQEGEAGEGIKIKAKDELRPLF
jgi:hypothetical protein